MSMTAERRRLPLVTLLCALALAACDGGIFGTGDGSSDLPIDADAGNPSDTPAEGAPGEIGDGGASAPEPVGSDDAGETSGDDGGVSGSGTTTGGDTGGGTTGGTTGGMDGGDTGDDDAVPLQPGNLVSAPSSPFTNTQVTGTVPALPRVRLVNATRTSIALLDGGGVAVLASDVAPGEASEYAAVPLGTDSLTARRPSGAEGGEADSYRLEPLLLGTSTVTTLVVRDADDPDGSGDFDGGIDIVPLVTLTSPDDAAQTFVRVVQGVGLSESPDEVAVETFTLVPDGASPGGVEVTLGGVSFDDAPATDYRAAPAGDYLLSGSGGGVSPRPVSLAPDTVYTFVIIGADEVSSVIDGSPGAR